MTPQLLHIRNAKECILPLKYDNTKDVYMQKKIIKEKYLELLGMPEKQTDPVPYVEYTKTDNEDFDEIRFTFESEPGFYIPAHLLLPKKTEFKKLPIVICLQGHSTGMHISLGRVKYKRDEPGINDRDFAIQAVKQGFAAVAMEQRGFGELKGTDAEIVTNCTHMSLQAIIMGRTLLGERCFDVSRLIDALAHFGQLDTDKIGVMGNSGGGTATFNAACVDERIKVAMPSCSFCPYFESIVSIYHCNCNYIPGIMKYMEMQDLAVMIAPRPLVIVAGNTDDIFPIEGVLRGYETVKEIYKAMGKEENCSLVIGEGGHRFYAKESWPIFNRYLNNYGGKEN